MRIIYTTEIIDFLVCSDSAKHNDSIKLFEDIENNLINAYIDKVVIFDAIIKLERLGVSRKEVINFFTVLINLKNLRTDMKKSLMLKTFQKYMSSDNSIIDSYLDFL